MRRYVGVAAVAALAGCVKPPPVPQTLALQSVRFDQLPGWRDDRLTESFPALRAQCHRLALLAPDTALGGQGLADTYGGKPGEWATPCRASAFLVANDAAGIRTFYETWFQPYRILDTALFSGYYEPEVFGARAPDSVFKVPLLARPTDLLQGPPPPDDPRGPPTVGRNVGGKFLPYFTRAEIEAGAMAAAAHPLLWLRDPADLFFLQIQGSGRVRLADGSVVRVGYGGQNGRPYTPIGRVLLQMNALAPQDISMQNIRGWLAAHPDQAKAVMDRNEDYVFFRQLTGADATLGPPGALGVDLSPARSAAVDPHFLPLGTPVFLDTTDPISGKPWQHLLLAQDSGTDIRGPARVDIFFGAGAAAEQGAGRMHAGGTEYVLLPRPVK